MDWSEKKGTIRNLVTKSMPSDTRHCRTSELSRRQQTLRYHLKISIDGSEMLVRVCKEMFLATFGLRNSMVLNWPKFRSQENSPSKKKTTVVSEEARNIVKEFLESLPKMESHYCES